MDRDEPDDRSPLAQPPDALEVPGRRRIRRRLASLVITVAVLAAVALLGFGLVYSRSSPSPGPSVSPATVGADGIPAQIDGQRVYRVSEQAEWQTLSGSFLLGGYAVSLPKNCPISAVPTRASEADLVDCGPVELLPYPITISPGLGSGVLTLASLGSSLLGGWEGGPAIVVRVHTHDPEAANCGSDSRAACEAAVVVEGVVWPVVPSQIAAEHVYRAADQASFAGLKGSFLLGGLVAYPAVVHSCPSEAGPPGDGQGLLPYCYWPSIDGLALSPKGSFDEPGNEIVVARVHVNDPLAAECQPSLRAECDGAIVVESVVWRSNPYATPTPSGTPAGSSSAAALESPSASPDQLRYEDGTSSVVAPFTDPGGPVYEMRRLDATSGWALVGSPGALHLMLTDDAGATWRDGTPSAMVPNPWVDFLDANHGWVLQAMASDAGFMSSILRTSDGGRHWSMVPLPVQAYTWAAISFVTTEAGCFVVTTTAYPKSQTTAYKTTDGGSTWQRVATVPGDWQYWPPNAPLVFFGPDDGLLVSGTALHTRDAGKTWTAIDLPHPADVPAAASANVSDLVVGGGAALVSVGFTWKSGGLYTGVEDEYISHDLGQTWSLAWRGGGSSGRYSVVAIDDMTWLRFPEGSTSFEVTHDGGVTWATVATAIPSNQHFAAESFTSALDGWAIISPDWYCPDNRSCPFMGDRPGQLAETRDGGVTWRIAGAR